MNVSQHCKGLWINALYKWGPFTNNTNKHNKYGSNTYRRLCQCFQKSHRYFVSLCAGTARAIMTPFFDWLSRHIKHWVRKSLWTESGLSVISLVWLKKSLVNRECPRSRRRRRSTDQTGGRGEEPSSGREAGDSGCAGRAAASSGWLVAACVCKKILLPNVWCRVNLHKVNTIMSHCYNNNVT